MGWSSESHIFQNPDYTGDTWRLDFAKETISVEVAFNHSTVIAWNLIKPVLASELNHVEKAIQTKIAHEWGEIDLDLDKSPTIFIIQA